MEPLLPISILLANHQPIVRSGLRLVLERESDFKVVAEAANGREAIVLAEYKRPEIALLEMKLPLVHGITVSKEVSANRRVKPIFVTADTDESYINEAFKAGAKGYVAGDSAPADLARAVRVVASGRIFLSPVISAQLLDGFVPEGNISALERELWWLAAAGYSEAETSVLLKKDVESIRTGFLTLAGLFMASGLPETILHALFEKPLISEACCSASYTRPLP